MSLACNHLQGGSNSGADDKRPHEPAGVCQGRALCQVRCLLEDASSFSGIICSLC